MDASITGGEGSEKMNRIARRFQSNHDKNVKQAFGTIRHYSDMLNLSKSVQEISRNMFEKAEKLGKLKGKPLDAKVAAIVYMASKIANNPKNLREVIEIASCKRRDVTRCYKMLTDFMPITNTKDNMKQ